MFQASCGLLNVILTSFALDLSMIRGCSHRKNKSSRYMRLRDYKGVAEVFIRFLCKALDKEVAGATEQRQEENKAFNEMMASDSAAKELLGIAKNRPLGRLHLPDEH